MATLKIPLSNSLDFLLIDEEDFDKVKKHKWKKSSRGYATVLLWRKENGRKIGKSTPIHQLIFKPEEGKLVDHINRNKLDNRKENLRSVTAQQNMWNKASTRAFHSSKYKGVSFCDQTKKWKATLSINGKRKTLGRFNEEEDAAMVFDYHAQQIHGEYGYYNSDLVMGRSLSQL